MTFMAGRGATGVLRTAAALLLMVLPMLLRIAGFTISLSLPLAVTAAVIVAVVMMYIPLWVRSFGGRMGDTAIYVRYGVLWKRETVVPFEALRTYEIWTPPLHGLFRCRTVVLRFAGGCVWLPLLDRTTAAVLTGRLEEL